MFIITSKTILFSRVDKVFSNRREAAELLAEKLSYLKSNKNTIVLGIPRGGVVIADVLSEELDLPMSLMIIRKIGAPSNPELAIGAIGTDGKPYFNQRIVEYTGASEEYMKGEAERQFAEIKRRLDAFGIKDLKLKGKSVILTDDGIATGATISAAIHILKQQEIKELILAIPVCPPDTADRLEKIVDKLTVLEKPPFFSAVGQFYSNFHEVTDENVKQILISKEVR